MDREQFPEGPSYSNEYFLGGDEYGGPYSDPKGEFEAVEINGMDITIKMAKPFPDMPYWGTFPAMGPIPEGPESDPAKYRLHPLATGPYMFGEYTPEKSLTLVRNPEWDPATDPGRTQYPDEYVMEFDVQSAQIDEIMINDQGEAQTTISYDDVLAEDYREMEETGRLAVGTFPLTSYWAPDYRKITDIRIRQALAWAYPYADADLAGGYIEGVTSVPATSLMPPGTPGRTDFNPVEGHEPHSTDPEKARELLEEAGEVGYEISWLYAKDDPLSVDVKDVVQAALKEAGFTPKPVATTVADFSTLRSDPDTDVNVRSGGWIADWPSGATWFPPVLGCTEVDKGVVGANYSIFCEQEIEDEITRIQTLPLEEQPDAWGALDEKIMTEYLPLFGIRYGGVAQMYGSKIEGYHIDNTIGMPTWKNIWVNE
ncbi:MAG TPA: ABC transporter substrate-binding protein, partial [Nocardioides sp.]|nr:ABC transporter substrate-binding protein [Nocardioides sp.]